MGAQGQALAAAGQMSIRYGEALLKDIKADQFARKPSVGGKTIDCNHPAWVYGHLSLYAARVCELLGVPPGPAAKPAGWDDLFNKGTPCNDDPSGQTYPPMERITRHFLDAYAYAFAKLAEASDEVFARPNPAEGRFKEMLPTIGGAMAFLVSGHPMSHLGQVSTWRRCVGLPSAM